MKQKDVHRAWAPDDGRWSPWVKPVLFAHLAEEVDARPLAAPPTWLRRDVIAPLEEATDATGAVAHPYRVDGRLGDVAVIVDLPGETSAVVGIALAAFGFRPVPLYNAVPSPVGVVDLRGIMAALADGAERIATLPAEAPPAFLVDADRARGVGRLVAGAFDNRSFFRQSDVPSAETLLRAGIRRVLILQGSAQVAVDLEATLSEWQARGLQLWGKVLDEEGAAAPLVFRRRLWPFRVLHAFQRAWLRPRSDDTYGRMIEGSTGG
jgi:hypothetical protein